MASTRKLHNLWLYGKVIETSNRTGQTVFLCSFPASKIHWFCTCKVSSQKKLKFWQKGPFHMHCTGIAKWIPGMF